MRVHLLSSRAALHLFLLFMLLVPLGTAWAQTKTVSGTVTDANDNSGLPGVNILIKGSSTGTISDIEGNYTIQVPSGDATLVYSSIGFLPIEVEVGSQSEIDISLQADIKQLSEVVVTGYTAQSRRDITSAVSVVEPEQLLAVPATNLAQQLQGRAAGVTVGNENTPGGGVSVRIRGYGTLGDNDPLYVIDGVPTKDNLNTINQNDIESIQILKDASSASIYGARAANGVVIITTKKGKAGAPKVTFDAYYGTQRAANSLNLLNTEEFGRYFWESRTNANAVNADNGFPQNSQYGNGPSPVIPDYIVPDGAFEGDPRVNPDNYSNNRFGDPEFGSTVFKIMPANRQGTNWFDEIFDPAPIQNYQLGVSGGSETGRYAFSMNYFDQQGILIHNGYKRYTIRANTEFNIKDRVRIGENLQVALGRRQGEFGNQSEGNQVSMAYRMQPIVPVYDIAGNFAGTLGGNLGNARNPVAQLFRNRNNGQDDVRVFGNVFAEVDILPGLTAKTSFGLDATGFARTDFNVIDPESSEPAQINSLNEQRGYRYSWTWTNTLNYEKSWGDHNFTAFGGVEAIESYGERLDAGRQRFFSNALDLRYLGAGDPTTATNNGFVQTSWSLFSYFGRADYSFRDKYLFQATLRRDASSRFIAAERFATFPALSAGWRISEESFMAGASFVSDLKLRFGWGQTGNQEIGDFNAYTTYQSNPFNNGYSLNGNPNGYGTGFDNAQFGNPNARWETTTTSNLGIDGVLFNNRLDFSLDLYTRLTDDLLYTRAYDPKLGDARIPAQNIASVENRGIDFQLGYTGSGMGGDFRYNISGNISMYRNEVLELDPENPEEFFTGFGLRTPPVTRSQAGQPLSSFFGYIVDGIMQNEQEVEAHADFPGYYDSDIIINGQVTQGVGKFKYRDINNDGVINADDQTYIGNPHPDFNYGLNINLGYKNFDLTMFAQGVQGNELFNYVRYWTDFETFQGNRSARMLYDSWRPDNPNASLPILDANDAQSSQPSSYFVEDGSYLRLRNIQLSYTLPQSLLSNIGMSQAKVYVQSQNLFTITNYSGLDPEVNLRNYNDGADRQIGVDEGVYPAARAFIIGINVGF